MSGPKSLEQLEREHYQREERDDRQHQQDVAERVKYNEQFHREEPDTRSKADRDYDNGNWSEGSD